MEPIPDPCAVPKGEAEATQAQPLDVSVPPAPSPENSEGPPVIPLEVGAHGETCVPKDWPYPWKPRAYGENYSEIERQAQIEEIDRRLSMAQTQTQIAREIGLARDTVFRRIQDVQKRWEERALESRESLLAREKAHLLELRKEALAAWERSKLPAKTRKTERGGMNQAAGISGAETKASLTMADRTGNPQFLQVAIQISEKLAKLFGLNAPDLVGVSWIETVDAALEEARKRVEMEREARAQHPTN